MYEKEIEILRRRIPDLDAELFSDFSLSDFLDDEDGNWKLALASVWETIAHNHLLLYKVNVRSDDAMVTASTTSALYLKRAAELRDQVLEEMHPFSIVGGESLW